jgi:membrane fusion protein (multidrug efflux system)
METKKGALLVPQRAVSELQGAHLVGVVGADGKADIRNVKVGERIGSLWIIEKGLNPGDKVIVEGLAFVKPGMTVNAKPAPAEGATPASPSPPPATGH